MPLRVKSNRNGKFYYLHSKMVQLKNWKEAVPRYYFKGSIDEEHVEHQIPQGWEPVENAKNGVPFLRRVRA